jgi:signal transduction histidine kinase
MPIFTDPRRGTLRPGRLFVIVLASVFAIETFLMLVLPKLLPDRHRDVLMVLSDGLVLTAVLAPILWVAVIRPLQQLVVLRTVLLRRVLTIQEDERGRVAREMHDGLGQSLTSMLVGLRAIEELTGAAAVKRHLEDLRRIASSTHDEVRRIARGLRPSSLDDVGLTAALERFCQDVAAATAGQVEVALDGFGDGERLRLDAAVETACFRIVQEATANAIRHGGARRIRVSLAQQGANIELMIDDNGCGTGGLDALQPLSHPDAVASRETRVPLEVPFFGTDAETSGQIAAEPVAASDSLGLWSIRERVALLSGSVEARSHHGQGLSLLCRFPRQQRKDETQNG